MRFYRGTVGGDSEMSVGKNISRFVGFGVLGTQSEPAKTERSVRRYGGTVGARLVLSYRAVQHSGEFRVHLPVRTIGGQREHRPPAVQDVSANRRFVRFDEESIDKVSWN